MDRNIILDKLSNFFSTYKLNNFGNDIEFAAIECKRHIGFEVFSGQSIIFNYKLSPVNQPPTKVAEILFLNDSYEISQKIEIDFEEWKFIVKK